MLDAVEQNVVNAGHFANTSTKKYYYKDSEIKYCILKRNNVTAAVYNLYVSFP